MKFRKYILFVAIFASTILSAAKANAHGSFHPTPPPAPVCPSNNLPIDGNVILLTIAGAAIGVMAIRKNKPAVKPVYVKK